MTIRAAFFFTEIIVLITMPGPYDDFVGVALTMRLRASLDDPLKQVNSLKFLF